jgi:hypothetical protein
LEAPRQFYYGIFVHTTDLKDDGSRGSLKGSKHRLDYDRMAAGGYLNLLY